MGYRYFLTITCPECGKIDNDVYYAPTCGVVMHGCTGCGHITDLEKLTGISYQDASNLEEIKKSINKFKNSKITGEAVKKTS